MSTQSPNAKKKQLTFIDLFAGIGGIRIAFERAGAKCVYSSEVDKDCQITYEANFGDKPDGDIREVNPDDIPNHDILTGGFPCQSFSIIGKRLGTRDERGTMFFEIEKILKKKQPYSFLLENVKQLTTIDGGETFQAMLKILKDLSYFVHWKVLNGLDFGWPQKRERVVIVGFKQNHPFKFPQKAEKMTKLEEILEPDNQVDPKYFISERVKAKLSTKVFKQYDYATIWHENKSGNIGIHEYSCALRANASYNYLLVNGKRRFTPRENLRFMGFPDEFKIAVPDSAVRKQAGNSVVIPMIQGVAQQIIIALNKPPADEEIKENIGIAVQQRLLEYDNIPVVNYAK